MLKSRGILGQSGLQSAGYKKPFSLWPAPEKDPELYAPGVGIEILPPVNNISWFPQHNNRQRAFWCFQKTHATLFKNSN